MSVVMCLVASLPQVVDAGLQSLCINIPDGQWITYRYAMLNTVRFKFTVDVSTSGLPAPILDQVQSTNAQMYGYTNWDVNSDEFSFPVNFSSQSTRVGSVITVQTDATDYNTTYMSTQVCECNTPSSTKPCYCNAKGLVFELRRVCWDVILESVAERRNIDRLMVGITASSNTATLTSTFTLGTYNRAFGISSGIYTYTPESQLKYSQVHNRSCEGACSYLGTVPAKITSLTQDLEVYGFAVSRNTDFLLDVTIRGTGLFWTGNGTASTRIGTCSNAACDSITSCEGYCAFFNVFNTVGLPQLRYSMIGDWRTNVPETAMNCLCDRSSMVNIKTHTIAIGGDMTYTLLLTGTHTPTTTQSHSITDTPMATPSHPHTTTPSAVNTSTTTQTHIQTTTPSLPNDTTTTTTTDSTTGPGLFAPPPTSSPQAPTTTSSTSSSSPPPPQYTPPPATTTPVVTLIQGGLRNHVYTVRLSFNTTVEYILGKWPTIQRYILIGIIEGSELGSGEQFPSVLRISVHPGSCVLTTEVSNVNLEDMKRLNASLHSGSSDLVSLGAMPSTLEMLEKLPENEPLATAIVAGAVIVIILCILLLVWSVVKCANRAKWEAQRHEPIPTVDEKMRLTSNRATDFEVVGFSIESGVLQRGSVRIHGFQPDVHQMSTTLDSTTLDDIIGGPQEAVPQMPLAYPNTFELSGEVLAVDLTRSRLDFANSVWSDSAMLASPPQLQLQQQQRQHAVVKFQF